MGEAGEEEGGQGIKPALAKLPPETETLTGEEDEETVWSGEGTLYEFNAARQWRERGKGELKINRGPGRPARFVMRQRGYLRLLMNASLWADMKVSRMDGGKVGPPIHLPMKSFACGSLSSIWAGMCRP